MQWKLPAGLCDRLRKYKYVLLVVVAGVLLLLPSGKGGQEKTEAATPTGWEWSDVSAMESRLGLALSEISGAGKVKVMLTLKDGGRTVYAQDTRAGQQEQTRTTVVIGRSGEEAPISIQQFSPTFQGALAICPGGGDPGVRLELTRAICALTGLSAEKVLICQSGR